MVPHRDNNKPSRQGHDNYLATPTRIGEMVGVGKFWGKCKDVSSEEDEEHKGNRQYITYIKGAILRARKPSKIIIKRNIDEPMVVRKKEGSTLVPNPER